ncbi:MAG: TRAP transporter large permease subunit, partial [Mesorhizobium sp.]
TLLAIPFFTFMGIVLERSGMAEDLLDTIGQLFGPIRGGLAYAVIFVGALLAVGISASGIATGFGFVALMLVSVNIFGGFLVTQRMLAMYKKKDK